MSQIKSVPTFIWGIIALSIVFSIAASMFVPSGDRKATLNDDGTYTVTTEGSTYTIDPANYHIKAGITSE